MGKAKKAVTKAVSSTVKAVTKPVTKVAKSFATAGVDAVKSVAKGDVNGLLDAGARAASGGTISLQGKNGIINTGLLDTKVKTTNTPVNTDIETDGLLQYVSDLRTRKSRRNRASTVNTDGSASNNLNKLGGTTALGV